MKKTKYEEIIQPNIDLICEWVSKGYTSKAIAEKLGIAVSTFKKYKKLHKELGDAFARAQEAPNRNVENALYRRACGYRWEKIKRKEQLDRSGQIVELIEREIVDVPPDPTTAMFWLTNMNPAKWQYRPEAKADAEEADTGGVIEIPAVIPIDDPKEGPDEQ